MKRFLEKILLAIIVLGMCSGGCNNDEEFLQVITDTVYLDPNSPFALPEGEEPTHYYIRWLTTTAKHVDALEQHRSTNALYGYPLHENVRFANTEPYYSKAAHYSVVPADAAIFSAPNVEHHKLANLHVPLSFLHFLDGNDYIEVKGLISVEDDTKTQHGSGEKTSAYRALPGVDVRIRLFNYAVYRGTTNQDGEYRIRFPATPYLNVVANNPALNQLPVRVNIFYQTDALSLRTEEMLTLAHGPDDLILRVDTDTEENEQGTKYISIEKNIQIPIKTSNPKYQNTISPHAMLAHAYRGGHKYFHEDIDGTLRPSSEHPVYVKTTPNYDGETGIYEHTNSGGLRGVHVYAGSSAFFLQPSIPADIYSITCHELAHSAHARMIDLFDLDFKGADGALKESWATGLQMIFTRQVYPGYEFWGPYDEAYSGIVVDLVDGVKDAEAGLLHVRGGSGLLDKVYGYGLQSLEESMRDALTLDKWIENVLEGVEDRGEKQRIEALLKFWKDPSQET